MSALRKRPAAAEDASPGGPGEAVSMSLPAAIVRTARPRQWVKNVLVLAAPGAAGVLTHGDALRRSVLAFALFCLASSGTYFVNDALDAEADRRHPTKRHRPIAAGALRPGLAIAVGLVAMAGAAGIAVAVGRSKLAIVIGVYARHRGCRGRLRAASHRRWCGRGSAVVQLVPHRGLLRLAPHGLG